MRSLITGDDARFSLVDESPDEAVEGRPEYFSFTVIREPVDRFRSNFELFCRSDRPMRVQQARALFGRPPDRIEPEEFFDLAARYWNHHWESMTRFLPSDPGILDHISTLESLADDWNFLSRRLSIHQGLPRHNRGRRDAARWSPTLELANNIGRRYSQDVRLYDTVSASRSDSDPTSGGA